MAWEVYTYGSAEYVRVTLNAVAALTGQGDYVVAIKLFALIGFLWAFIMAALGQRILDMIGKLLVGVLFYLLVLVPKVDVIVTDRIDPAMSSVVSNVPAGVGIVASVSSRVGDWLTRGYEAVFSLPDDVQYHKSGYLFGAHLAEASTRFELTDQRTAANLAEFWNQCVFYDVMLGLYSWDAITWNTDLWGFLQANTSQVRRFNYTRADGTRELLVCRSAVAGSGPLAADLTNAIAAAEKYYSRRIYRGLSESAAITKFSAALPVAYQYLTDLSLSSAQILRQNVLANALQRGASSFAASSDASAAAVDYAVARAEAERRNTFQALGELALRFLPLLRNILEALFYAVTPIVILLAFVAPKQTLVGWLQSMAWLQLWAPLYAVLHFGMMFYGREQGMAGVILPDGTEGLSLATATALGQALADMGYVANYLTASIPFIAFMIVKGGGMMAASLVSQVMSGIQTVAARGAEEATTGNIGMGVNQQDNINWFKNDRNAVSSYGVGSHTDQYGNTHTLTPAGGHAVQSLKSSLGVDANVSEAIQYAKTQGLSRLEQATHAHGQQYTDGLATSLDTALDMSRASGFGFQKGDGWSEQDAASWSRLAQKTDEISRQLQDRYGFSREQADKITAKAIASLHTGIGFGAGGPGGHGLSGKVGVDGQLRLEGEHVETDKLTQAYETVRAALDKETVSRGIEALKNYSTTTNYQTAETGNHELAARLHSSLQDTQRHEENWEASRSRLTAAREEVSRLESADQTVRASLVNEFVRDLYASGARNADFLLSHGNEDKLAQTVDTWLHRKLDGEDGVTAARHAVDRVARSESGFFDNPFRREVTEEVDRRDDAVDTAERAYGRTVTGEGAVRHASAANEDQVLHKPLSGNSPHAGAAPLGLDPGMLGQTPLTDRQWVNDFKEEVDSKTDPTLGQAALDVSEAAGRAAGQQHLRESEVESGIEQGRRETNGEKKWWWPF